MESTKMGVVTPAAAVAAPSRVPEMSWLKHDEELRNWQKPLLPD
jgi:hypothetical protein